MVICRPLGFPLKAQKEEIIGAEGYKNGKKARPRERGGGGDLSQSKAWGPCLWDHFLLIDEGATW